jgi:hypothetical protein
MKSQYFPPEYKGNQFHCILCGVFASQSWSNVYIHPGGSPIHAGQTAVRCSHCWNWSFWLDATEKMIVPSDVPVGPPHPELPADCVLDYSEARDVFGRSSRAAAALLRLCIQKLMPHLGEKGKNINDDIGSLVSKGLPVVIQQSLDFCRVVGNNAVHPGEIDLNDSPEIAQQLFGMINFIVDDRIARPKEIASLYATLPEKAREAIEKRDKVATA